MRRSRPGFRATEWTILGLALLAAAYGAAVMAYLQASQAMFHFATAPAFIIIVLTLVHMWARRAGIMSSSRYLAMFTLVLGVIIAMSGFVAREHALYAWGELAIGGLLVAVAAYEAWISYPSREGKRPLDRRTGV